MPQSANNPCLRYRADCHLQVQALSVLPHIRSLLWASLYCRGPMVEPHIEVAPAATCNIGLRSLSANCNVLGREKTDMSLKTEMTEIENVSRMSRLSIEGWAWAIPSSHAARRLMTAKKRSMMMLGNVECESVSPLRAIPLHCFVPSLKRIPIPPLVRQSQAMAINPTKMSSTLSALSMSTLNGSFDSAARALRMLAE